MLHDENIHGQAEEHKPSWFRRNAILVCTGVAALFFMIGCNYGDTVSGEKQDLKNEITRFRNDSIATCRPIEEKLWRTEEKYKNQLNDMRIEMTILTNDYNLLKEEVAEKAGSKKNIKVN